MKNLFISVKREVFIKSILTIYIFTPFLIFAAGWLNIAIAIFVIPTVLYGAFSFYKNFEMQVPQKGDTKVILLTLLISSIWVVLAGIGGYVFQNKDQWWRNEMFSLLVANKWPVITYAKNEPRMFCYYIGFFLPAALIGKLFGLEAGFAFMTVWAIIGVFLTFMLIGNFTNKWKIGIFILIIFFSGLDLLCFSHREIFNPVFHIDNTAFQLSSMTTLLFWVYNQAIYGWIITMIILNSKNNRNIISVWALGILNCTLCFAGMFPFVIYKILNQTPKKENKCSRLVCMIKSLITPENVLCGGIIGTISYVYLNSMSVKMSITIISFSIGSITLLLRSWITEFLLYSMILVKNNMAKQESTTIIIQKDPTPIRESDDTWIPKNKAVFKVTFFTLLFIHIIKLGEYDDFGMRGSIPALLVFATYITEAVYSQIKKKKDILIVILFFLGCLTPIHEISRTIVYTYISEQPEDSIEYGVIVNNNQVQKSDTSEQYKRLFVSESEIMSNPRCSCKADDNIFNMYLSK